MFENLLKWFKGLTDDERELAGYQWAKEELRAGSMTSDQILDRCEDPFDGPHPFDKGACRYVYEHQPAQGDVLNY